MHILNFLRQRFADRKDSEHHQALTRLAFVLLVVVYFFSPFYAERVDESALFGSRLLVTTSLAASFLIFAAIVWRPHASVIRRYVGIVHDVVMISIGLYLSEQPGAVISVMYLWITIGNGFRYGLSYLFACGAMSIAGFSVVYLSSDWWQSQGPLSLNVLLAMLVVGPYVASMLRSLHEAKDALQQQASTDVVTGLLSRSEFENCIRALYHGDHEGHVLLFCDLDRFKRVNDVAGHAAGDRLLADIGHILQKAVRKDDRTGRMGGDEFCVLLQHCSLEKGQEIAETIRRRLSEYRLAWKGEHFSVGVSIGVVTSDAVKDPDMLFRLADAACYAAKNAGRNRVHIVDPRIHELDTQKIRLMQEESTRRYYTDKSGEGFLPDL